MLRTAVKTQTAMLALLIAIAPATLASTTSFTMHSPTGEYVGQGLSYNYGETDGDFAATTLDNGESVILTGEVMINAQTVPVESATWGKIKSLYK